MGEEREGDWAKCNLNNACWRINIKMLLGTSNDVIYISLEYVCMHEAGNFLQKDANFCSPNRKLPLCVWFPRASALKSHLTLSLLCGRVFVCWQSGAISSAASSSRPQFTETRREEAMIHTVLSVNRLFYGCITQARAHYRDTHTRQLLSSLSLFTFDALWKKSGRYTALL